ncbi:MAG: hypothetical protein AAF962_10685 [Actinomycetota bacterium]
MSLLGAALISANESPRSAVVPIAMFLIPPLALAGLSLHLRRWQWSSVEVNQEVVLVRNPTRAHQLDLARLVISEPDLLVGFTPGRLTLSDGTKTVKSFGLGKAKALGTGDQHIIEGLRAALANAGGPPKQRQPET